MQNRIVLIILICVLIGGCFPGSMRPETSVPESQTFADNTNSNEELLSRAKLCDAVPFQTLSGGDFNVSISETLKQALNATSYGSLIPDSLSVKFGHDVITPAVNSGLLRVKSSLFCRVRVFSPDLEESLESAWIMGPEKAFDNIRKAQLISTDINAQKQTLLSLKSDHTTSIMGMHSSRLPSSNLLDLYDKATGTLNFVTSTFFQAEITGIAKSVNFCGSFSNKLVAAFPPTTFTAMEHLNGGIRQILLGGYTVKGFTADITRIIYEIGYEIIDKSNAVTATTHEFDCIKSTKSVDQET